MTRRGDLWRKRGASDLLAFFAAYVITAYFAASAHPGFAESLWAHSALFLVSVLVWYLQALLYVVSQSIYSKAMRPPMFIVVRLISWFILINCLAEVIRPSELQAIELVTYTGLFSLLFTGRFMMRLNMKILRWHTNQIFTTPIVSYYARLHNASYEYNRLFLPDNTVRGSPA